MVALHQLRSPEAIFCIHDCGRHLWTRSAISRILSCLLAATSRLQRAQCDSRTPVLTLSLWRVNWGTKASRFGMRAFFAEPEVQWAVPGKGRFEYANLKVDKL